MTRKLIHNVTIHTTPERSLVSEITHLQHDQNIMGADFCTAEKRCLQHIEIAKVLKGAVRDLAS